LACASAAVPNPPAAIAATALVPRNSRLFIVFSLVSCSFPHANGRR
jgi:hypothetical protein